MTESRLAARLTPFELAFGDDRFEADVFPSIRREADARNVDTAQRERFLMLGAVGQLLRELRPDAADIEPHGDSPLPPPDAVREYGPLLFHAFRFWEQGRHLLIVGDNVLRDLLGGPVGDWRLAAPHAAGYFQLPRHLVWSRIDDGAPPEAIDGFFWSIVEAGDATPGRIELLLALGMHPGRPGFSVIEVAAPLPAPPPGHWGDDTARSGEPDFANILPGGELRELLAVESTVEVLKLVSRIFHVIDSVPGSLRPAPASADSPEDAAHALPPSSINAMAITDAGGA